MQRLEVSGAVRPIYGSLGVKLLMMLCFVRFAFCMLLLRSRSLARSETRFAEMQIVNEKVYEPF